MLNFHHIIYKKKYEAFSIELKEKTAYIEQKINNTSVGISTTGWQSKPDPTSRTMAVNSLPPSRNISMRTLSSIPYQNQNQGQMSLS